MKKVGIGITAAFIVLAVILMLAVLGFKAYDSITYSDFYDIANEEFYIPDLMDGYVPQGFEYMKEEKSFLACGYMSDGESASRVYVISECGDEYYYTELMAQNGDNYTGHTGGIAYSGDYLFITGDDGIDVFMLSDIIDKNVSKAAHIGTVKSSFDINPAYCFTYDGYLYTGAFQRDEDYQTPSEHHMKTPSGDQNKALMVAYDLNDIVFKRNVNGAIIDTEIEPAPRALYSMPSYVQGVCVGSYVVGHGDDGKPVYEEKLMASTSWGLTTSHSYVYDMEKVHSGTNSDFARDTYGVEIPLYYLDGSSLEYDLEAPPMAEEIVYHEGKIWIMNESASNKYIFGKITTGNYLFSVEYPIKND